jgi:hypothetical protein
MTKTRYFMLTYGAETWTKANTSRLMAAKMRFLTTEGNSRKE